MDTMRAVAFEESTIAAGGDPEAAVPGLAKPSSGSQATTICGTDVHIVKGEYAVRQGLILGHEPVGIIDELGEGLEDEYRMGSG